MMVITFISMLSLMWKVFLFIHWLSLISYDGVMMILLTRDEFGLDKYLVKPWDRDQLKGEFDKALDKQSKKIKEKNISKSNISFAKLNKSLLPEEKDLRNALTDCFIVRDETDENFNNYWFGDNDDRLVVAIFNAREKENGSIALNSFINMSFELQEANPVVQHYES